MAQYLIRARLNLPLYTLSNATTSCGRSPDGLSSHDANLPILTLNRLLTKFILYANNPQYILIAGRCYLGQSR